jgi:hypothetical protein
MNAPASPTPVPSAKSLPSARQRMWNVIRIMRTNLDAPMVALSADVTRDAARAFLRELNRKDILICTFRGGNFHLYKLAADPGPHLPGSAAAIQWGQRRNPRAKDNRQFTNAQYREMIVRHVAFLRSIGKAEHANTLARTLDQRRCRVAAS